MVGCDDMPEYSGPAVSNVGNCSAKSEICFCFLDLAKNSDQSRMTKGKRERGEANAELVLI